MVEVAIVIKIVQNLHKAWSDSKRKLTIGVVSPYAAQVVSIQDKLARKYEKLDGFSVKVKSIDGFQGGEEDIIILSTVRSNSHGYVGFLFSLQRTNVALTRARHCLWILGNERTLVNSESIWKDLVWDARNRGCVFDADVDDDLKMTIISTKKELDQLDDLVNGNSVLFKNAKWKVLFSDDFRRSFGKLTSAQLKKLVLNLLLKLSSGWRPKNKSVDLFCESSSHILKQFKVEGLYVICTTDIIKECKYIQVLKVWDILKFEEIPKLTKRLESIFTAYTEDYINRCAAKCLEGNLEVPRSWPASQELTRFRYLSNNEGECEVKFGDGRNYVENTKVSESLLLMKFYSLSSGVVNQLLSGKDVDLPMQVTDEQMDIILFCKSSFIIGRSGTGKTTILTMKLFQKEQLFHVASEGFYEESKVTVPMKDTIDDPEETKPTVLRQLFVTVSPKLCYAVKQHVSHLVSISSNGNSSAEINLDEADVAASDFSDIPDTFVDIPMKSYPLVITFHKFLMMLDGTLGNSYFERFLEAREVLRGNHISSRSVALQTFIRSREVTFDRFCSLYWPHFNSNLTKRHDPSRVFTEIISHIKGGLEAGDYSDGKLSYERYCLLAESRSSTLTEQKRETVYSIFQVYEKMKSERGEFDLGDLVNDLHRRLKTGNYEGDQMDFVYIDEVQDLSMRQISLFKYICQNVDEGFIFAGDTAQTIARGIDFRFQDIRSLFYKEFISNRLVGKQEKGHVSEIFQLKQNFRTHAGVLGLSQSVIDILYCYFSYAIDILEPETSLISGEPPVLLESGNDENAIVTIFGGTGTGGEIVGFGAEQVILVRDNSVKTEICEYVGKHALVLTIVECKGLEFQDVLLYNFFGSSPLKEQWRVIYAYMKKQNLLDEKLPLSFPSFSEAKHNVLCSELKQLYVAITRTRQRLWICENKEELSKPMFDYWKRRGLVQVRELDDSVAEAMRVASSPQEWRDRGKKLFYENNFVMATMCFERAGDRMWEILAKASGLRSSAEQMRGTNPEAALGSLRIAAGMFESIGKLESAATCYCDLGEYKRAGRIYLDKCGQIDAASECFMLAGCYSDAAEAYAKGNQFSNCLSVCKKGKLFDLGMKYIEYWKVHVNDRRKEIEQLKQEFLENCALDCYERKDPKSMMNYVRAFCSIESKRGFLRSVGCLDDLLLLEEESGHFLDAAELARSWGDLLKEADLLVKAGRCVQATLLILWYMLSNSLWKSRSKGWPLKQFAHKEELCKKAKSLAKTDTPIFYDFVCNEVEVLSDQHSSLKDLKEHLHASQKHKSLRGEILSIWKILDLHLHLNSSEYYFGDESPIGIHKQSEAEILQDRVTFRTLVFYWNLWKENVVDIFRSLESLENEEPCKHEGHIEFILNFFGVRKQYLKGKMVYMLINKDADWVKNADNKGLHRDGKLLTMDIRQLARVMRSYWQLQLRSIGIKVLESLEALHKSMAKSSEFHQSTSLLQIYEVAKFLLDCQYLSLKFPFSNILQQFLKFSTRYFDFVFPLDWRKSVSEDLISLRESDVSLNLLEEIIFQNVDIQGDLTFLRIGCIMMICLSSRKPVALKEMIIRGLEWNPAWKSFFEKFYNGGLGDMCVAHALQKALEDTFKANWRCAGYISPHSFVHLLDVLLFMASFSSEIIFTTKSSFIGCFKHFHPSTTSSATNQKFTPHFINFVVGIIQEILYNVIATVSWIENSNINPSYYHPLLALRLVMILSLLCLQVPDCSQDLLDLLSGKNNIAHLLPGKFVYCLLRGRNGPYFYLNPDVVAEAFICIGDPLLVLNIGKASPRIHATSAIFVDFSSTREDIMRILFPTKSTSGGQDPSNIDGCGTMVETQSSNTLPDGNSNLNPVDGCKGEPQLNWKVFEDIFGSIDVKKGESPNLLSVAAMIKKNLDKDIHRLATAHAGANSSDGEDAALVRAMNELKALSSAFDTRNLKHSISVTDETKTLQAILEGLEISKPMIEDFLIKSVTSPELNVVQKVEPESSNTNKADQEDNQVEETDDKDSIFEIHQGNWEYVRRKTKRRC